MVLEGGLEGHVSEPRGMKASAPTRVEREVSRTLEISIRNELTAAESVQARTRETLGVSS